MTSVVQQPTAPPSWFNPGGPCLARAYLYSIAWLKRAADIQSADGCRPSRLGCHSVVWPSVVPGARLSGGGRAPPASEEGCAPTEAERGGDEGAQQHAELGRAQELFVGEGEHGDKDRHGEADPRQQADQEDAAPREARR